MAASVIFSDGLVTAQSSGTATRVLGKGSPLSTGETVTVGDKSFAVVEFADGTKATLRPGTVLLIQQFNFKSAASEDGMVLKLLKGGIRAMTGLIGKQKPEAVNITTSNATIGIRGTRFDARLCDGDCGLDKHKTPGQPTVAPRTLVARAVSVAGAAAGVVGAEGARRNLAVGGQVYESDIIETGAGTIVTLLFSDQTRVTVNPATRFEVTAWKYSAISSAKAENNGALRLISGAIRVFTGLIGKINPTEFKVRAANSTIGIRGTGFDLHCTGECAAAQPLAAEAGKGECGSKPKDKSVPAAGAGLFAATWDGAVSVTTGACRASLSKGQALFVDQRTGETRYLPRVPAFMNDEDAPRPDTIQFNYDNLFGFKAQLKQNDGLYTYVRDGHVRVEQQGGSIDLAPGEAGYADFFGRPPIRLAEVPGFIEDDPYPLPETFDENNGSVLELMRENARYYANGAPGQCTIK